MHWLKLLSRVTGKFLKCKGTLSTYTLYYSEIALEIINSDHWDKAMRMCNENNITPMRLLIEFMPGNHGSINTSQKFCITCKHTEWNTWWSPELSAHLCMMTIDHRRWNQRALGALAPQNFDHRDNAPQIFFTSD